MTWVLRDQIDIGNVDKIIDAVRHGYKRRKVDTCRTSTASAYAATSTGPSIVYRTSATSPPSSRGRHGLITPSPDRTRSLT